MASPLLSQPGTTRNQGQRQEVLAKGQSDLPVAASVPGTSVPSVGRVLHHARKCRQLSLRDVEREIGRSNAYLSQIERGVIRRPDPAVLLQLSDLYHLDFMALATWAGWLEGAETQENDPAGASLDSTLIRSILNLRAAQQAQVLGFVNELIREDRSHRS